jgi:hypothetical protein
MPFEGGHLKFCHNFGHIGLFSEFQDRQTLSVVDLSGC